MPLLRSVTSLAQHIRKSGFLQTVAAAHQRGAAQRANATLCTV
jgi:hypothetical protein